MRLDPRLGAVLDNRYQTQVELMDQRVQEVTRTLETDKTSESITRLDLEYNNLISLFASTLTGQQCALRDLALLYMHLSTYMMMRGMYPQMVGWGIHLFEWYKREHVSPPAALFQCIAMGHEGTKHYEHGLFIYNEVILKHYADSLSPRDRAALHYGLSRLYYFTDEIDQAAHHILTAIEYDEQSDDKRAQAMSLAHYSELLWYVDDHQAALTAVQKALTLADEIDNMLLTSTIAGQKAKILAELADPDTVIPVFEGALQLYEFRNDEISIAQTAFSYGEYLHKHGRFEDAYRWMERSIDICERYGLPQLAHNREQLAAFHAQQAGDSNEDTESPNTDA